jgi:hypothetical protein
MRWKLIRRRLSVSAPRMIIRSHLPWPLRWAVAAVVAGFSAALALWAFDLGQQIAGIRPDREQEVQRLQQQVTTLRSERDRAQSLANAADGLLKAGQAAQASLAQDLARSEARVQSLQADLDFFERLLPAGEKPLQVRALQAEAVAPGQTRYQLLVMQAGKNVSPFEGRYDIQLAGAVGGTAWRTGLPGGPQPLKMRQYARVEGLIDHPPELVLQSVTASVTDAKGVVLVTETLQLAPPRPRRQRSP